MNKAVGPLVVEMMVGGGGGGHPLDDDERRAAFEGPPSEMPPDGGSVRETLAAAAASSGCDQQDDYGGRQYSSLAAAATTTTTTSAAAGAAAAAAAAASAAAPRRRPRSASFSIDLRRLSQRCSSFVSLPLPPSPSETDASGFGSDGGSGSKRSSGGGGGGGGGGSSSGRSTGRNGLVAVLIGQLIAFIASGTNATSFALSYGYGAKTQLFQLFFVYALLASHLLFRDGSGGDGDDDDDDSDSDEQELIILASPTATTTTTIITTGEATKNVGGTASEGAITAHPISSSYRYPVPFFTGIKLKIPWTVYLLCGLLDVLPNFLTLLSFQYTSLTSTTLLGSLTVPSTMVFSRFILSRSFSRRQYVGVALCVFGGMLTIWSDAGAASVGGIIPGSNSTAATTPLPQQQDPHRHSYVGDLMALGAAVLYALGDTVAEYSIKHADSFEYLGMLGLNGAIITGILCPILERREVRDLFANADAGTWSIFALYVGSVVIFYVSVAYFLVASDVTLLVLSLQTSNLWAVLFSVAAYRLAPPPLFYAAAVLVVSGVAIYQWSEKKQQHHREFPPQLSENTPTSSSGSVDEDDASSEVNESLALNDVSSKRDYETML